GKGGSSLSWRGVFSRAVTSRPPRGHPPRFPAARLGAALVLLTWLPRSIAAQSDKCVFQITNVDRQGNVVETPQGTNYFAGGNVRLGCKGQPVTMQADSVAAYGGNVIHFIGNVRYRDSTLT